MKDEIETFVHDWIAEHWRRRGRSYARVAGTVDLLAQGIVESLSFLTLVTALEKRFTVEIDFSEVVPTRIATVEGLVETVARLAGVK